MLAVIIALGFVIPGFGAEGGAQLTFARKVVFGSPTRNAEEFRRFAIRAQQSGATHIVITAEDLPWARWQYDQVGDPYPTWAISNHGLLKVSVPRALETYIPKSYSESIFAALTERCQILAKLGLKAMLTGFEPQMMPEKVYDDHPSWRGPQVDSPLRSRVPRFAVDVDSSEVLALYRESMKKLLTACPQIDTLSFYTNDSGSGISWSEGVYQGANGNSAHQGKPMEQRYREFFSALRAGAVDAGVKDLEIDLHWDREKNPALIAQKLSPGTAIANLEGPHATPYKSEIGFLLDYLNPTYPVRGIPQPISFVEELEKAFTVRAPRLFIFLGDETNRDLYFQIFDAFVAHPVKGLLPRLAFLQSVAATNRMPIDGERLLEAWVSLDRVERDIRLLNRGGTIFYLGSVQQRWLTRPFVPYPERLAEEDRNYFRRFQLQASTEGRANDLLDLQGSREYSGLGGRNLTGSILMRMNSELESARRNLGKMANSDSATQENSEASLTVSLRAFQCLVQNCRNAVDYQYNLDVTKEWSIHRPFELGKISSIPEWLELRRIARKEIDNTAELIALLEGQKANLLFTAASPVETDIRLLEPDLVKSLKKKLKIMNAHWEDYDELFLDYGSSTPSSKGK